MVWTATEEVPKFLSGVPPSGSSCRVAAGLPQPTGGLVPSLQPTSVSSGPLRTSRGLSADWPPWPHRSPALFPVVLWCVLLQARAWRPLCLDAVFRCLRLSRPGGGSRRPHCSCGDCLLCSELGSRALPSALPSNRSIILTAPLGRRRSCFSGFYTRSVRPRVVR